MERQFRRYFDISAASKGNTGVELLMLFERRLDNVVYRSGMALSRPHARQLVNHGHITVNDKKVDISSYQLRKGDVVGVKRKEKSKGLVKEAIEATQGLTIPSWLGMDGDGLKATVNELPTREEFSLPLREQLVIEFCSK